MYKLALTIIIYLGGISLVSALKVLKDIKKNYDREFLIFVDNIRENPKYDKYTMDTLYKLWKLIDNLNFKK